MGTRQLTQLQQGRTYTVADLSEQGAPLLFGWLIARKSNAPLTYGEVARRLEAPLGIQRIFPTHIGSVAGRMMELIHGIRPRAPLINALVVDAKCHLPGEGITSFLVGYYGRQYENYIDMPLSRRRQITDRAIAEVRSYRGWIGVYQQLFGHKPPTPLDELQRTSEKDGKSPDGRLGGGGEGLEHKRLKAYVAERPNRVTRALLGAVAVTVEAPLLSGDSVDVRFDQGQLTVLVEVKSRISNMDDLMRGLYQCIKYKAVAEAEAFPREPEVRVYLIVEEDVPREVSLRARQLNLKIRKIRVPASFETPS